MSTQQARSHAPRPRLSALLLTAALIAVPGGAPAGASAAAPKKKPKVVCKAGTIPKVTGSGAKAKLVLKKGTAVCVAPPKAKVTQIEPAAATQQGTISSTADQLTQALTVRPDAFAKIEAKLGPKATKALIAQSMTSWRAGARASARRLADDGYHYNGSFGDPAKGTKGSAKLDAGPAGEGGQGIAATATIEFTADGKGLQTLGADKVTDAKSAGVKIEISFEDAPAACPTAAGKVKGTLKAKASLTITTDGATQTMSAEVNATYELTVGADAHWKTIDNVDVQTTFAFGGSGKGTETWRGRRGGSGFGQRGIFGEGSGDFTSAIAEQQSHIDPNAGGVWGPRGRVLFSDPSTDNVFNYGGSIAHLKGMVLTDIATTYLTYAAVEYIRHIVGPRGDKHWYDDEACLKFEATPDKAKLGPAETATVTAKNAKAADGTPVAITTTESGVASLVPAAGAIPAGGSQGFTLTAPNERPTKSSWKIVALSPAGKKTLDGSMADAPKWRLVLHATESSNTAGYSGSALMDATADVEPTPNTNPQQWSAVAPLIWSNVSAAGKDSCSMHSPVTGGNWAPMVTDAGGDQITVTFFFTTDAQVSHTIRCPDGMGGFYDQAGMITGSPVALNGVPFTFPSTGGVLPVYNKDIQAPPDDYLKSEGTLTVTPIG